MIYKVECPCCRGATFLLVYDEKHPDDPPQRMVCTHCQQRGTIPAELTDDVGEPLIRRPGRSD